MCVCVCMCVRVCVCVSLFIYLFECHTKKEILKTDVSSQIYFDFFFRFACACLMRVFFISFFRLDFLSILFTFFFLFLGGADAIMLWCRY